MLDDWRSMKTMGKAHEWILTDGETDNATPGKVPEVPQTLTDKLLRAVSLEGFKELLPQRSSKSWIYKQCVRIFQEIAAGKRSPLTPEECDQLWKEDQRWFRRWWYRH